MEPLFLLSLPRSGSTLVQRTLAGHSQIATVPEPWFLLPLAAACGRGDIRTYTNYSQRMALHALGDLVTRMPGGEREYLDIIQAAALQVYESAGGRGHRYFLDKTPRYFLIVDFILELFPDAKIIVLSRHPLDVLASVITTWGGDRLWLHHAFIDLYDGPRAIHAAMSKHADRVQLLRYEDLVAEPEVTCRILCSYLDLEFESGMLSGGGKASVSGRMGDKSKNIADPAMLTDSVSRWKSVLATPVRRWFARRYLRDLGPAVLATFGVDAASAAQELDRLPVQWRHTVADIAALATSYVAARTAATVVLDQWRRTRGSAVVKLD